MIVVYGANGFIGSKFSEKYNCYRMGRNDIIPPVGTTKIIYFISTVDNYNIFTNPYIDIETNLIHLIRVLESCKNKNIDFIFISSWFVYGNIDGKAKEDSCCNPKGFYSITKRTAEQLIDFYCGTFDIKFKIIRLSNVIGIDDKKKSVKKNVLQYLINEIKKENSIKLYNDGDFYRDFIYIDDVVDGIKFIADNGKNKEIYNLGSGISVRFRDVIDFICYYLNVNINIEPMEIVKQYEAIQIHSIILDTEKLKDLGFTPKYTVYESIKKIL